MLITKCDFPKNNGASFLEFFHLHCRIQIRNCSFAFMLPIHQILKQYWGFEKFRPLQEEIIQSVLNGNDTLALLPTGGGKSICFQVPALALDGLCLVVSPLIALMKDQVYNLNNKGIRATAIYSGLPAKVIDTLLDNCVFGKVKFLYISPERLCSDEFRVRLNKMKICLLAIDEAHCISQWGYDFRPSYLRIAEVREQVNNVPVIALTATATPKVVEDIQEKLSFKVKNVLKKSFVRSNLSYVVRMSNHKEQDALDILCKVKGTAVIYTRNRKGTKLISDYLLQNKVSANFYHAGLTAKERSDRQDSWIKSKTRVICCTNAFGMGIDKPDVRVVIHADLAESIEAYFQEAGRAGRDEKKAYAILFYNKEDIRDLDFRIDNGFPTIEFIRDIYDSLGVFLQIPYNEGLDNNYEFALETFSDRFKVSVYKTMSAIKILEQQEIVAVRESLYALSSIKCVCGKESLVRFQETHRTLEPMVKFILRTTEGVFEDYCLIDEYAIAPRLKISVDQVREQLVALNKYNVFSYRPRSDKPQVTFLKSRVKKEDLRLDLQFIADRKSDFENRLKAVRSYLLNHNVCRTRLLVKYFGEDTADDCGICDVCVARKKSGISAEEFCTIVSALEQDANSNGLVLSEFKKRTTHPSSKVDAVVDFLIDKSVLQRLPGDLLKWI